MVLVLFSYFYNDIDIICVTPVNLTTGSSLAARNHSSDVVEWTIPDVMSREIFCGRNNDHLRENCKHCHRSGSLSSQPCNQFRWSACPAITSDLGGFVDQLNTRSEPSSNRWWMLASMWSYVWKIVVGGVANNLAVARRFDRQLNYSWARILTPNIFRQVSITTVLILVKCIKTLIFCTVH